VGSQKRICRGQKRICRGQKRICRSHNRSLTCHHLQWRLVTVACKNNIHYYQVLMAVVKITVTWTQLSHLEGWWQYVPLKWQPCSVNPRMLQSCEQSAICK
jgi:hypothetical protein